MAAEIVILAVIGYLFAGTLYRLEGEARISSGHPDGAVDAMLSGLLAVAVIALAQTRLALVPTRHASASHKRFIGDIAHELRTPLSIIKAQTEVALMDAALEARTRETFASTVVELDRASEIINNNLTLSTALARDRMRFSMVDLDDSLRSALRIMRRLSDGKNIAIQLHAGGTHAAWGNPTALSQIWINILNNAITHTETGGHIGISLEQQPRGVLCRIRDSGEGIAPEHLAHIFEPYYRADPSRARAGARSGLGLTIVSDLVRLHGGAVHVTSTPGSGTTVSVYLPSSPPDPRLWRRIQDSVTSLGEPYLS